MFSNSVMANIDIDEPRNIFERVFTFNGQLKYNTPEEHIQNSLYFEIKTFLPGLLLVGDKLSMANGMQERFPFGQRPGGLCHENSCEAQAGKS
ncbi:MAG: hypothetical protein IPJ13_24485 [Saprospiraceae bacterium]|nr:hypothetical protein [Saprospiraceae bacterium]